MDRLSAAKRRILNFTKYEMLNKALEAFGDLGDDEELGPTDWPTVKRYITTLNDVEGDVVHPHAPSSPDHDGDLNHMNLKDIRVRFLNGVQAAYWVMLDEGRINQTTANLLMQSVDEAIDLVSHEPLCDWKGLKSNVNIPNHYKFLRSSYVPQKLITYFTVERLESACCICAAFLRAHRTAREQLHEFIGDSEIAAAVIRESEQEGEEARAFLEDVRVTFPQVLRVVKTRQVTYAVLNYLIDYVHNLEKIGLLEEKETNHLHDSVQTDLKKLLRNPPLVKIPKVCDLVAVNPLLGALPSTVRETLIGSTKEIMKLRGATLYQEGSRPSGVWLISSGVVKWSSKNTSNRPSLHPTFTHGSTLGLYEVLAEKPYTCDVVADSVVICFFIESEKILSALRVDPAVEDFFWKESVIVLAKLLLPQLFEKMPMHELRALVSERSTMNIYLRGESFEVSHHCACFLLEGFIRTQGGGGQDALLTAPASVSPRFDQSFGQSETLGSRTESFLHHLPSFQVETRARVIIIDTAGFDGGRTLKRRSSSLISHSDDHLAHHHHHSGLLLREHGGLMSWPEQYFIPNSPDQETSDQRGNNLSAKAMELGIYGSMINNSNRKLRPPSFPRSTTSKPSHSLSYPRVPSGHTPQQPLVSIRSEGSTTLRKKFTGVQERSAAARERNRSQIEEVNLNVRALQTRDENVNSSDDDDSGGEDEHIVRIDSPSSLSFRQDS